MRYHLIAIGGSVMHNVGIDLVDLGHHVTGSDDEIYEPSRSRLKAKGLLPDKMGWDVSRITADIDVIILGKHAKSDNPELAKAQALGLKVLSFPEFVSQTSTASQRVAITGSHGKTSTTAMIMYALKQEGIDFDYLVGAQIEGFGKMVRLSGSDILVVEGDEYPSSCLDDRAKMLHYKADISVVTGIAWDHVNIYKTFDAYKQIFKDYLLQTKEGDIIFFDMTDGDLVDTMVQTVCKANKTGYQALTTNKKGQVEHEGQLYDMKIFGEHNFKNANAALHVCSALGLDPISFLTHMQSFKGAAKRLELIHEAEKKTIYKDFAHAPSKAKATSEAVRTKHPSVTIKGILELHTFSSLNQGFIEQYRDTLHSMDEVRVFYDPQALELKRMPALDQKKVEAAFNHPNLKVFNDSADLGAYLDQIINVEKGTEVVLIMSSGNLGGNDLSELLDS